MKYCTNCGNPYEEGSKFCKECGSPLSSTEVSNDLVSEADIPEADIPEADIPEADIPEADIPETDILEGEVMEPEIHDTYSPLVHNQKTATTESGKENQSKKRIVIGIIVIVLIIAGIAGVFLLNGRGLNESDAQQDLSLTYVKDNQELFFLNNKQETPILLTNHIVDSEDSSIARTISDGLVENGLISQRSPEGKKIAYLSSLDEEYFYSDLYVQNVTDDQKADEESAKVKVSAKVLVFHFIDENRIAYIKIHDNDDGTRFTGDLYLYDIEQDSTQKISANIDFFAVSDNGETLLLIKNASDDYYLQEYDLYLQKIDGDGEKTKIDSGVAYIHDYNGDFTKLIYSKDANEDNWNSDVYRFDAEDGKKKILSNVYSIVSADVDGNVYYYKNYEETLSYEDTIVDDKVVSDAGMSEPDYYDFYTTEVEYDYYWDEYYYYDVMDYDAYDKAYEAYQDKVLRDDIRNYILENPVVLNHTDLYFINQDNEETRVAQDVESVIRTDSQTGGILYLKKDSEEAEKCNIADITSIDDIPYYGYSEEPDTYSYYVYIDGYEPSLLFSKKNYHERVEVDADWSNVYYLYKQEGKENGTLYGFTISNGEVEDKAELRTHVGNFQIQDDGALLIFADADGSISDLYLLKGEKETAIGTDVERFSTIYHGEKDIFLLEDYDEQLNSGTLVHWLDGTKTEIAKDIYDYYYIKDDLIYLYKDYNDSRSVWDIYRYDGTEEIDNIDYDVSAVQYTYGFSLQSILNLLSSY